MQATTMANSSIFLLTFLFLSALIISSPTIEASGDHKLSWIPTKVPCQGSVAECIGEDEFHMGSEISRRILQTASTQYLSYGALQRDTVPCSQRGASYYNCQPGAEANPYSRGCSAITRCRN
ncbi:hypothetical protein P3X46_003180 [Hevea brasiliensis]|uniref:Uncharacterized protein n=1 Tax=Hevea brasiliensis TaxID=3981 RepID=A0ABQ9N647_HEVBR|nr:protein RALF-like 33 [Hevea brasiliensis]KAJ9187758.1 hypothetical protein P3X46_003180 [Hevea brasiliensis]